MKLAMHCSNKPRNETNDEPIEITVAKLNNHRKQHCIAYLLFYISGMFVSDALAVEICCVAPFN